METATETIVCRKCHGTGKVIDRTAYSTIAKTARKQAKATLRQIALSMNLSIGYLSDLENGRKSWSDALIKSNKNAIKTFGKKEKN